MNTLLNGPRTPDDASVRDQILYLAFTPIRLIRQRTAVNLIVSYVAMALITVILLLSVLMAVVVWPPLGRLLDLQDITLDPYLGEQARAYGLWLDPDALQAMNDDGLDPAEAAVLTAQLQRMVTGDVPGFTANATDPSVSRVARAALVSLDGNVIASHDSDWISPGAPITDFPERLTSEMAARSLMLAGDSDPAWGAPYSMAVRNERTTASYPLMSNDGEVVAVLVIEGNSIRQVLGLESQRDLLTYLVNQYWSLIWVIAIPAVIVATPFGWWRARSISRRLERLAAAADAMAEGDLAARVKVNKPDEIGRLGERFNQMATTIESTDRARRAFISNVSHELRTPLSIIQGTVERELDNGGGQPGEAREALELLRRESIMLERMISDLFTVTKGLENGLRLDRKPFDIAPLASEAVAGIQDLAWSESRVSIESLASPDLPAVFADPIRVRQVLNNLLYNALRHTPEGGLVVVQAKPRGTFLELSVSDTGRGIPNEEIDLVFQRYYQAERGTRHDDSSGLGLSVVQQLVHAHGGEIAVESTPGEGTTFRFTLPLAP